MESHGASANCHMNNHNLVSYTHYTWHFSNRAHSPVAMTTQLSRPSTKTELMIFHCNLCTDYNNIIQHVHESTFTAAMIRGSHSITCHPTQVNTPCLNPSQRPVLDLLTLERWNAKLTLVTDYIPRWFTHPQMVNHTSTNPAVQSQESNLCPVDHKSDALTTTLPSHLGKYLLRLLVTFCHFMPAAFYIH